MKIVVFGANGPTGRLIVSQGLSRGHEITAVTRNVEVFPLRGDRLRVVGADVYDPSAVEAAIEGQDAVLSSLGVPYSRQPIRVYSEGVSNIMRGMTEQGLSRLICVSSSQVDPSLGPHGGFFVNRVAGPIVGYFGRTLYADMVAMESLLRDSELDWTIMRPSGLFVTPEVTDYRLVEDYVDCAFTSRTDLADAMLTQLSSDEYLRRICAIATVSEQPSIVQLVLRESSGRKPNAAQELSGDRA
jgi:putative NADH-flavin reductase